MGRRLEREVVYRAESEEERLRNSVLYTGLICRELTLQKGDIVYIHKEVDKNWLEGEHHGRLGIFPANYVEVSGRGGKGRLGGSMCWERLRRQTPGFLQNLEESRLSLLNVCGLHIT